jgi:ribosomal protein S27AE
MSEGDPIEDSSVRCSRCGYNLTGVSLGGTCPECGASVSASFHQNQAPASGKAITAMVLGISSLPLFFGGVCGGVGVGGLVALPAAVLAIGFWYAARKDIQRRTVSASSNGMAIAGLVCGSIGGVLSLSCAAAIVGFFVFGSMQSGGSSFQVSSPGTTQPAATAPSASTATTNPSPSTTQPARGLNVPPTPSGQSQQAPQPNP